MRTGKHQFNYVAYSVEWAVKILANVNGYTLEKAYSIDRVFGLMVEQRINLYKQEIEMAKNFSVMCGVYGEMYNEYQDFGKYLSEEVEFFNKHRYDWGLEYYAEQNADPGEFNGELDFGTFNYHYEDWKLEYDAYIDFTTRYKDQLAFNKMITRRISNLFINSSNLSLSRINQMPKSLANNFKTMKQLAMDTASSVKLFNMTVLSNQFYDEMNAAVGSNTQREYDNAMYEIDNFYTSVTSTFINVINTNNIDYHNTLNNTYEQIRRLLDD